MGWGGKARVVAGARARYLLDVVSEVLHLRNRRLAPQSDRPLEELSGTKPARLLRLSEGSHEPEYYQSDRNSLSRGLLEPHPRLLVVR